MSSPMNRQSNMPILPGNNGPSVQSSSSNNNISNIARGWPGNASLRSGYRGRGRVRGTISSSGPTTTENQRRNRRRERRGRIHPEVGIEDRLQNESSAREEKDILMTNSNNASTELMTNSSSLENGRCDRQEHEIGSKAEGIHGQLPNQVSNEARTPCLNSSSELGPNQSTSKASKSSTRVLGGKHKQRREARQLIDGLDGLDIDLFESLVPTDAEGSNRARHLTSTRKINLSHLVNYNYDRKRDGTRLRHDSDSRSNNERFNQKNHFRYNTSVDHKFSKRQFLQANCQFVVLDGYDYTIHKVDPDWPVDWNCIEEVKFRQIGATETNCPICLEQPTAAKITRCGHIYCWTCMLRYLSLSEENNVSCPICFEPIYVSDLRSVVSQSYPSHAVGENITMNLMFRRRGCVEVEPYNRQLPPISGSSSQTSSDSDIHYRSQANLIIVDPITVMKQIARREKNELQTRMELELSESACDGTSSSDYSGIICFIEQALEKVNRRIERLIQLASDESRASQDQKSQEISEIDSSGRSYLFYQSIDGQHIYLNPFSTKILCHEYGTLENCPLKICADILQMDWISMNEGWRKRFKYLEHLPLSCEFRLIEIDFERSNLLSYSTFKLFESQIKSRSRERDRRLREEAKRDKQIQVEQNRKIYGIQPSLEISLDNPEQFPSVLNERYLGIEANREISNENNAVENLSDEAEELAVETADQITLSFAEIQLQEAAKAEKLSKDQRKLKEASRNVWPGPSSSKHTDPASQSNASSQSSFAQLLVDAKTSQQQWTKSTSSSSKKTASSKQASQQRSISVDDQQKSRFIQSISQRKDNESDEGGEELKAPPCEFSMSDYLNLNVVSGKKRGRKKKS